MQHLGFVGLGMMGAPMAANLLGYLKFLAPGRLSKKEGHSSPHRGLIVYEHPKIVSSLLHYLAAQPPLGI